MLNNCALTPIISDIRPNPFKFPVKFCDIHNHVLPGVDDGAQSLDVSLRMIEQAIESNIDTICATPHITADLSEHQTLVEFENVYNDLRNEIFKRGIELQLERGCEIYFTSGFPDVGVNAKFRYLALSNYLLVELPPTEAYPWFADICFNLKMKGINVLLAHPERNAVLMRNPGLLFKYIQPRLCIRKKYVRQMWLNPASNLHSR